MSVLPQTESISHVKDCIARAAAEAPDKTALIGDDSSLSYRELDQLSSAWAAALAGHGIRHLDHIAVIAANSASLVAAMFGAWKLGVVVHHHNPATKRDVLCDLFRESNTRALIVDPSDPFLHDDAQLIDSQVVVLRTDGVTTSSSCEGAQTQRETIDSIDDLACVSYTSGSTGIPCGVELSHRYLIRNAELNMAYFDIAADDRVLLTLPLFFGMNRTTLLAYLMAGATIVLPRAAASPDDFLGLIDRRHVTSLSIVPSIAHQLTAAAFANGLELSSLHSLRIGAGAITRDMLDRLSKVFPNTRFWITYGLTEIGLVSVVLPDEIDDHFASCGRAVDGVSLRIETNAANSQAPTGSGEVVVSAVHQALGYAGDGRNESDVFRSDGIHTGDLGFLDGDGFLHLCGRSKELIKTAGISVAPRELEDVIRTFPGVEEVVVLGVPNRWLGEALVAAVSPVAGQTLEVSRVHRHCTESLPSLKRPQCILLIDQIPRTPNGKADRQAVFEIVRRETENAAAKNSSSTRAPGTNVNSH